MKKIIISCLCLSVFKHPIFQAVAESLYRLVLNVYCFKYLQFSRHLSCLQSNFCNSKQNVNRKERYGYSHRAVWLYLYMSSCYISVLQFLYAENGAWDGIVVKALRYWSEGPGIDSQWCHWGCFPWGPPTEPRALGSTQPLKMSTRDFSWGKGGRCLRLTTYHPCSAERQENPGP